MKNRFDLIIFDWDGTLVNSIDWIVHCIQQAAVDYVGRMPDALEVKDIIGLSLEQGLQQLFPELDAKAGRLFAARYAETFTSKPVTPDDLFSGVHEMLLQFKADGYHLAVATGKKSVGLMRAMASTGVSELFCTTRSADQTASKPDPQMIEEIIRELNIEKHRTLMVGDSRHDLQMALNAGVSSIGLTCGAHSAEILRPFNPLLCLNHPADLRNFF